MLQYVSERVVVVLWWVFLGAARGRRTTGFLLGVTSPEWLHLGLAVIVFAGLLWLVSSAQWRRGTDA